MLEMLRLMFRGNRKIGDLFGAVDGGEAVGCLVNLYHYSSTIKRFVGSLIVVIDMYYEASRGRGGVPSVAYKVTEV